MKPNTIFFLAVTFMVAISFVAAVTHREQPPKDTDSPLLQRIAADAATLKAHGYVVTIDQDSGWVVWQQGGFMGMTPPSPQVATSPPSGLLMKYFNPDLSPLWNHK